MEEASENGKQSSHSANANGMNNNNNNNNNKQMLYLTALKPLLYSVSFFLSV
jgi:hypothetical protein